MPTPSSPRAPDPSNSAQPDPVSRLTPARHRALELIARHHVTLYRPLRGPFRVHTSGTTARITMPVYDALADARLITRDVTSSIHSGQRVLLTPAGQATLNALGAAPPLRPAPAPSPAPRGRTR
ncbi:hypothetical protein [Streptomyces sp. NPDC001889]